MSATLWRHPGKEEALSQAEGGAAFLSKPAQV
jgi:hypothetical protein